MSEEKEKKNQKQSEELSEQDLKQVTGGAVDQFLNIDGIKGESKELSEQDLKQVTGGAIDSFLKLGTLKGE